MDSETPLHRHPPIDAAWLEQVTEAGIDPGRPIEFHADPGGGYNVRAAGGSLPLLGQRMR